jgi:hypothetical protein
VFWLERVSTVKARGASHLAQQVSNIYVNVSPHISTSEKESHFTSQRVNNIDVGLGSNPTQAGVEQSQFSSRTFAVFKKNLRFCLKTEVRPGIDLTGTFFDDL